jgi:hypothetical protein
MRCCFTPVRSYPLLLFAALGLAWLIILPGRKHLEDKGGAHGKFHEPRLRKTLPRNAAPRIVSLFANVMSDGPVQYLDADTDNHLCKSIDINAPDNIAHQIMDPNTKGHLHFAVS